MSFIDKTQFIFLICTTPERKHKAIWLYHLLYRRIHAIRLFIVTTDPLLLTPLIMEDHEIMLKASNYYEDAATKTFAIFNAIYELFPETKGVFKCDDTILPNLSFLQKTIKNIRLRTTPLDYAGVLRKTHSHKKYRYIEHQGRCHNPTINQSMVELPRNLVYACHPLYYLSNRALKAFAHLHLATNKGFYEDVAVAHHLASFAKIFPQSLEFFHCEIDRLFQTSIYNPPRNGFDTYKTLYISLQGNLGERMFQTAAAYGLAQIKNMYLVFVDDSTFDVFHRIFLKEYPCIDIKKIDDILDKAYPILEPMQSSSTYEENLIPESVLATGRDVFMRGFFKHTEYFKHCPMDIFALFHSPLALSKQIFQRKGIANGFQAVRRSQSFSNLSAMDSSSYPYLRGSSVGEGEGEEFAFDKSFFMYVSETQSNAFLERAIAYIREYEINPYFYVLSHFEEEQTLETFECLKSLDKTIITIRLAYSGACGSHSGSDKSGCSELTTQSAVSDNNLIDALAIMSMCKRGGIVSHHDPVSWWGAFLNDNIRKIIVYENQHDSSMIRPGVYVKGLFI